MFKYLTKENVSSLIGKTIKFYSPQYEANFSIEGVAKLEEVDLEKHHPLSVLAISGEGDLLKYAFIYDGYFALGDSDRFISFEIVEA